jgi:hypothetical protein
LSGFQDFICPFFSSFFSKIFPKTFLLEESKIFWKRSFRWATHNRLKPVREVAHPTKHHLSNILTYITHPVTSAVSEGVNYKIKPGSRLLKQRPLQDCDLFPLWWVESLPVLIQIRSCGIFLA